MNAKIDYLRYRLSQIFIQLECLELSEDETEQIEEYLDDLDDGAMRIYRYLDELKERRNAEQKEKSHD